MFMQYSHFKTNQTICKPPKCDDRGMYHYLYKIINNINGKYYIGIHSTNNLNDGYCGSGQTIIKAYKKYGPTNFTKLIWDFYANEKELEDAEAKFATEREINDPDCYNINCGGGHHPVRTVTCRDILENKNVRVPQEEYYAHPERYVSHTKGQIKATDSTGRIFMAHIDDPRFKTGEIWDYVKQFLKDTFPARIVATGQNIRVHRNDPRLLTGEVVHVQKGRVKVIKDGQIRVIDKKHLQSYLDSGWEQGGMKGIKRGPSKTAGCYQIWKNGKVKTIHPSELDHYVEEGWQRGHGPKTALIYKDNLIKRVPLTELNNYVKEGWQRGNPQKPCAGKIMIHKGKIKKFIFPADLGEYINEGWQKGFSDKK